MKSLLLLIVIFPAISFSQNTEFVKSKYTEVVTVDSVSKDELYTRARSWFATAFKSANDVIQMEDREAGKIIGKGTLKYIAQNKPGLNGWIFFTMTLETKDGKYRILIEDLRHESEDQAHNGGSFKNTIPECGDFHVSLKKWNRLKETAYDDIINFVNNMKAKMQNKSASDNW